MKLLPKKDWLAHYTDEFLIVCSYMDDSNHLFWKKYDKDAFPNEVVNEKDLEIMLRNNEKLFKAQERARQNDK